MQGATRRYRIRIKSDEVSIHAPYAGSDRIIADTNPDHPVSIHAPYAGSDKG